MTAETFAVGLISHHGITNYVIVKPDHKDYETKPWLAVSPAAARRIGARLIAENLSLADARAFVLARSMTRLTYLPGGWR